MVEYVVGIRTNLEIEPFRQLEILPYAEVRVEVSGCANGVTTDVGDKSSRRRVAIACELTVRETRSANGTVVAR